AIAGVEPEKLPEIRTRASAASSSSSIQIWLLIARAASQVAVDPSSNRRLPSNQSLPHHLAPPHHFRSTTSALCTSELVGLLLIYRNQLQHFKDPSSSYFSLWRVVRVFAVVSVISVVGLDDKPLMPTYQVSKERAKGLEIDFIPLNESIKESVESLKETKFFNQ
ncbi:hypothetical protein U1Q18_016871, partial [Sarracenia purpurea var. burkii]